MNLRRSAAKVSEVWSHGHSADSPVMACAMSDLDDALSQPDMLAEAVELLRSIAQQDVARHKSYEAFTLWAQELAQDFTRRYDAAQQEQSDADSSA